MTKNMEILSGFFKALGKVNYRKFWESFKEVNWLYNLTMLALVGAYIGSVSHITETYKVFENPDVSDIVPWAISVGVELFMLIDALGIMILNKELYRQQQLKSKQAENKALDLRKQIKSLNRYLIFFAGVILFANVYYTLSVLAGAGKLTFEIIKSLDRLDLVSTFFLSLSLPFMTIVGSRLLGVFAIFNKSSRDVETTEAAESLKKEIEKVAQIVLNLEKNSNETVEQINARLNEQARKIEEILEL